jgi:glycosyltransferase involved in cell wall biosynthesis
MPAKILAAIIAHPRRKVCGATNAGRELSLATARLCDIEMAKMWDCDQTYQNGPLLTHRLRSTHPLGPLERFAPNALSVPLYGSKLPAMIRGGKYDLVHLHNVFPPRAAAAVARACEDTHVPYLISTHGFFEQSRYAEMRGYTGVMAWLTDKLVDTPFKRIVAGAAGFFALSDFDVELLQSMGVDRDCIRIVTNGVNEYYLADPTPSEAADAATTFGIDADTPMLFYMGSLHGYKGVDTFLESLKNLPGNWQAVVAGRLKDKNQPATLMNAAGLNEATQKRVTFTGGVSDAELRALYHRADLFVYPTRGDTLPLVVLEAMAGRTAVVSTTVGGIGYEVTPDCGILVPPGNAPALHAAVADLLTDEARRTAMAAAARARVETIFRWHLAAEQAKAGYEHLLGKSVR